MDNARCPACGAEVECVKHYLLECTGYAHERWTLKKKATELSKTFSLESLLGDPDLTIPLANFIDATQVQINTQNITQRVHQCPAHTTSPL